MRQILINQMVQRIPVTIIGHLWTAPCACSVGFKVVRDHRKVNGRVSTLSLVLQWEADNMGKSLASCQYEQQQVTFEIIPGLSMEDD